MKGKQGMRKQAVAFLSFSPNRWLVSSPICFRKRFRVHVPGKMLGRKAQISVVFVLFSCNSLIYGF